MESFDNSVDALIRFVDTNLPFMSQYVTWWMTQYRTNPAHVVMETVLFVFILYVYFKRPSARKVGKGLSQKEVQELLDEWHPEPLVNHPGPATETTHDDFMVVESRSGTRIVVEGRGEMIDMASFDFLGFSTDAEVKEECVRVLNTYGCGSCGPRGFYGTVDLHLELEDTLAKFFNVNESIMYSDSESTVASVVPAFAKRGDVVIVDEYVNDNLLTGAMLSRSKVYCYKHNDMEDLGRVLDTIAKRDRRTGQSGKTQRRFIITEGIFRNTGRIVDLPKIVELKKKHSCRLLLDESLSFGALGKTGRGATEHFQMDMKDVDIMASSCAATLGSVGGFCIGNEPSVVDHQRLSGAGYCFSASTPPFVAKAATVALRKMQTTDVNRIHQLKLNLSEILDGLEDFPQLTVTSDEASPVVHVCLSEEWRNEARDEAALLASMAAFVRDEGGVLLVDSKYIEDSPNMRVVAERSASGVKPSVPRPSLRIVASALHTMEDIDLLMKYLGHAVDEFLR
jgi:serine palmitoyltransferase|eukprot:g5876.t1